MMDAIEFQLGDVIIKLVNGRMRIWNGIGEVSETPDVDLPIDKLRDVLATASMLRKAE